MAFSLNYSDYVNSLGGGALSGGSEGGQGSFSGISEADWNKLSDADKWKQLGGGLMLASSDPRYADIASGLKASGNNPRLDGLLAIGPGQYKTGMLSDPNNIADLGNGVNATYWGNFSPLGQRDDTSANWFHEMGPGLAIAAALFGGAALAGAAGLGAGAGATGAGGLTGSSALATGGFGTDIAAGSGAFAGAAGSAGAGAIPTGGGFDENGVWHDIGTMDPVQSGGLNPLGPDPAPLGSNGSSFLHDLNTGRQYFNGARSVMNLLSGGQGRSGGSGMPGSTGSGDNWLTSLLGLLAGGHQAFGGGVGTSSGAMDVANRASALADPWGSSGSRAAFASLLTPEKFMSLVSQDPSAVLNNPAYKFELDQGTNAINLGDAAQGTLRSGNRGTELEQYGQGLAAKYGQQYWQNNMQTLAALSGLAGVNAGSPTAAAASLVNGFDNASNLRNAGENSLFSGGSSNPLLSLFGGSGSSGGLLSLLSQGGSSLWNWLSGGSSGDGLSGVDLSGLPDFNDTSGWNPSDFFSYTDDTSSLADATGAFF